MDELKRLGELRDLGLLSDEEFAEQKALVLPNAGVTQSSSQEAPTAITPAKNRGSAPSKIEQLAAERELREKDHLESLTNLNMKQTKRLEALRRKYASGVERAADVSSAAEESSGPLRREERSTKREPQPERAAPSGSRAVATIIDGGIDIPSGVSDRKLGRCLLVGEFEHESSDAVDAGVPGAWIPFGSIPDQVCRMALNDPKIVAKLPEPIGRLITWQEKTKTACGVAAMGFPSMANLRNVQITPFGLAFVTAAAVTTHALNYEKSHKGYFTGAYNCEPHQLVERVATLAAQLDSTFQPIKNVHHGDGGSISFWESQEIKAANQEKLWSPRKVAEPMRSMLDPETFVPVDVVAHNLIARNKALDFYQHESGDLACSRRVSGAFRMAWEPTKPPSYLSAKKREAQEESLLKAQLSTRAFIDMVISVSGESLNMQP